MAKFHNAGYKGLYNGETADDILKERNYVLGNYFGNKFIKDYSDNKKLDWNINTK